MSRCEHCGQTCNLPDTSGECWNCKRQSPLICLHCGHSASFKDWLPNPPAKITDATLSNGTRIS